MKRSRSGLLSLCAVALLWAPAPAWSGPPLRSAQPEAIEFDSVGLVSQVLVEVHRGLVAAGHVFGLAIEITGVNGGLSEHGQDLVPLADTEVFRFDGSRADVVVPWTADATPDFVAEVYTVCVQVILLPRDRAFGPTVCADLPSPSQN